MKYDKLKIGESLFDSFYFQYKKSDCNCFNIEILSIKNI